MSTVRALCKAGMEFYEQFLVAQCEEYKHKPLRYWAGEDRDSTECVMPDPRKSRLSAVKSLPSPLHSCLTLLLLVSVGEVQAQKAVNAPTFHSSVEMVLVPVTVTDRDGKTVEGLRAEDFNVFDDRKPQKIVAFSSEDEPCSVGLVLDVSGSMQQTLSEAKQITQAFTGSANRDDEFLLLTVSTQPAAMSAFTTDTAALEESIGFAKPEGLTALIDTVYLGLSRMRQAQQSRRALLIISDGADNHSRYSEKDLMSAALEADVQIYTIIVDSGLGGTSAGVAQFRPSLVTKPWDRGPERAGPEMLEKLSVQTGGLFFHVANPNDAKEAAIKAGRALRNEYVIGYHPADSGTSGRWHRIRVKSNASNLRVHAREGYYSVEDANRGDARLTAQ